MSTALLQIWVCASPVLATLLLAPMLVCAQPGAWLPAPVAAIIRAATPAQMTQFRAEKPEATASLRRKTRLFPRAGSTAPVRRVASYSVTLLATAFCQSAPRAP